MDNLTDKNGDTDAKAIEPGDADQLDNANRRRFSRNALVGSAVLLSLGNRSAWGGGGRSMGCMSLATINSFDPATGMFVSAPAGRPTRNEDLAAEIHRVSDKPLWQGSDGTYSSCKDPDSIDGVCLIKGSCP